jgi:flavin reductase (DIM6/NTAB) family NADH-FMN oxidoreductase RutF
VSGERGDGGTDAVIVAPEKPVVDPNAYRHVMSHFPTGVAVVTTMWEGVMHGMTANSLTSVSLDPVTLLVCFNRGSRTAEAVHKANIFAVNVLEEAQLELSHRFARPGENHFVDLDVDTDTYGLPILNGALAHLVCRVKDVVAVADHDIVIGEVEACEAGKGTPLIFFRGGYRSLVGLSRLG